MAIERQITYHRECINQLFLNEAILMSAVLRCKENRTVLSRYSLEINIFCHYPNKVIQTKRKMDVTFYLT